MKDSKGTEMYQVEDECQWAPGLRITSSEADQTIKLDGKTCACGGTLEFRLTHEFDHHREVPMIGGPGSGLTAIYKRVKNVICPRCGAIHSMEVYDKWREEKSPRRPGCIDIEDVKKALRKHRPRYPRQGRIPGRYYCGDNDTRYSACVR